jgi:hypothetical protein
MEGRDALTGDERAELERLRAEVATLRVQVRQPEAPAGVGIAAPAARQRWRTVVAALLIVLGCVLAPLAGVAVWARNQVTNRQRRAELHPHPGGQDRPEPGVRRRMDPGQPVGRQELVKALTGEGDGAITVESVLPMTPRAVLYDTIVRFLRAGLRTVFVLGLVVAAGAFLTGPSPTGWMR